MQHNSESYELPIEDAIELARNHHIAGNYVLAERTYHDILQSSPQNPTVNHLLGAMYYQLNNNDKAYHYMNKSIEFDPAEKQYWSNLGSLFYKDNQYDKAIESFDKALEIDPEHLESINRKSLALWKNKQASEAEIFAQKSLQLVPNNIEGLLNLALSLSVQKKYAQANKIWSVAHKSYPDNVQILTNWSQTLRLARNLKKSEEIILKSLELSPEDPETLNNLGCVLKDLGQYEDALEAFTKTTNITPKAHETHYNKALTYFDLNKYEDAIIACRYAIDFKPDYVDAYNILSSSLIEIGEFSQAHFAAQKAVQINPDNTNAYLNLADILYLSNAFDDGHAALKEALSRDPDNAQAYTKLASIYERLDEVDEALQAINRAIELSPHVPAFLAKKASILHMANQIKDALATIDQALDLAPQFISALITKAEILVAINRNDEALEILNQAKKIDPNNPLIYFTISTIKKFKSSTDVDLLMMESISEKTDKMSVTYKSALYYGLSRAYEDIGNDKDAFKFLDKANTEKRHTLPYNTERSGVMFANIKSGYSKKSLLEYKDKGFKSDIPVFIVGMPRSGTTLTEQIIASHPDAFGAGELPDILRAQRKVGAVTADKMKEVGQTYINLIKTRDQDGNARRIIDKMPANYMNIGLILSILPNAKIIHCCRNPMDTCLSNYKQNFMVGQYWSYDLEEMGAEYLRYLNLMAFWHQTFPNQILDVHYEETVGDLEKQARKLINFVDLEWNDACLMPHKHKRSVLTASKAQVTKPVYKTSVEKWKRYEDELEPLLNIFKKSKLL